MPSASLQYGPNGPNDHHAPSESRDPPDLRPRAIPSIKIDLLSSVEEEGVAITPQSLYCAAPLDKESCLDFIVEELGHAEKLPYRLPYVDGMQEVRKRLLARYGDERIGDAMLIVYDLIENKDKATGQGDQGDRWAPWRFAHHHRKDDFVDLKTPRFPRLVLPDPKPSASKPLESKHVGTGLISHMIPEVPAEEYEQIKFPSPDRLIRGRTRENPEIVLFERVERPITSYSSVLSSGPEPLYRVVANSGPLLRSQCMCTGGQLSAYSPGGRARMTRFTEELPEPGPDKRSLAKALTKVLAKRRNKRSRVSDQPPTLPAFESPGVLQLDVTLHRSSLLKSEAGTTMTSSPPPLLHSVEPACSD